MTKIPKLCVRDPSGSEIPGYFNIWQWILRRLTGAQRGGRAASPNPEAVLKRANTPINILTGMWDELRKTWAADPHEPGARLCSSSSARTPRSPRCCTSGSPKAKPRPAFRQTRLRRCATRMGRSTPSLDSKVIAETDKDGAKEDESRWMRFTLDTVGKLDWPRDAQGRALMPEWFEELAKKLGRPAHPPGRDVRCIVSVGMLTEGCSVRQEGVFVKGAKGKEFYIRQGNTTRSLDVEEAHSYIRLHWPA
jgi:type III restriction enzyme